MLCPTNYYFSLFNRSKNKQGAPPYSCLFALVGQKIDSTPYLLRFFSVSLEILLNFTPTKSFALQISWEPANITPRSPGPRESKSLKQIKKPSIHFTMNGRPLKSIQLFPDLHRQLDTFLLNIYGHNLHFHNVADADCFQRMLDEAVGHL